MRLSFLRRRTWKKNLAMAVTVGLLAGAYAPGAMAADLAITGNYNDQSNLHLSRQHLSFPYGSVCAPRASQ